MTYEINIALNGCHFFATHARSLTSELRARTMFETLATKFPAREGYSVTLTETKSQGRVITGT